MYEHWCIDCGWEQEVHHLLDMCPRCGGESGLLWWDEEYGWQFVNDKEPGVYARLS